MRFQLRQRRRDPVVQSVLILALTLLLSQPGWPQSSGAQFLLLSPSAVANGFGTGLVAASTEASAVYYNPAALSRLGQIALEGNTFKLLPEFKNDVRYSHLAGAVRSGARGNFWLGAAYTRLSLGEQIITGEESPTAIGKFEPYESAFTLAAAVKLGQHARLGTAFKLVRVNLAPPNNGRDGDASAWAVDFGFLYDGFLRSAHVSRAILNQPLPWQKWANNKLPPGFSLGVALANIGTKLKFIDATQTDPLPQNLRVGLAWNLIDTDVLGLVATGEFNKILLKSRSTGSADGVINSVFTSWSDQSLRDEFSEAIYTGGVEASFLQLAAIRCGRHWDGSQTFGFNTFGYSIGPPAVRFSVARFSPFKSSFFEAWRIYSVSLGVSQLPF